MRLWQKRLSAEMATRPLRSALDAVPLGGHAASTHGTSGQGGADCHASELKIEAGFNRRQKTIFKIC
jgi:hypothetical protein